MKSKQTIIGVCLVACIGLVAASASASPVINSAVLNFRIFDDCPSSTVTFGLNYPSSIYIQDSQLYTASGGFANRHNFRLSENGFTPAVYNNADGFTFFTDMTLTGTANEEAGINLSPWWSQSVDGVFTAQTGNGEIAAFSGRLPFYSFNNHVPPVTYTKGESIRLGVIYDPHSLSQADPATIEYFVVKNGVSYTSTPQPFDEGNPAEGHGSWGLLDDGRVGGYFQPQISHSDPDNWGRVDFGNIALPEPASFALLGLAGLAVLRRR
jgi:hypothetical protein